MPRVDPPLSQPSQAGDILIGNAAGRWQTLTRGATGQALTVDATGLLTWSPTITEDVIASKADVSSVTAITPGANEIVVGTAKLSSVARGEQFAETSVDLPTAIAAGGGLQIKLKAGTYDLSALQNIPSNTQIIGAGRNSTFIRLPDGWTQAALKLDSVSNVRLQGFSIIIAGSGKGTSTSYGVHICGSCNHIEIEDVTATGFGHPFHCSGSESGVAANAVLSVTIGTTTTSGTFSLGLRDPTVMGEPIYTSSVAYNATATTLQAAIDTAIGSGKLIVGGGPGTTASFTLTATGTWAGLDIREPLVADSTNGVNGSIVVRTVTRGGGPWITDLTLRRTGAFNSPTGWGMTIEDCDTVILDSCLAQFNWLDGLKLRRRSHNVQILGGDYSFNGQGWFSNSTTYAGDGMDTYSGGENYRVVAASFRYNAGGGVQVKNDDGASLSGYGSGKFGLTRKMDFIGIRCIGNSGNGLVLTRAAGTGSYMVSDVGIIGGLFERNGSYGIYGDAIRVSVQGPRCINNAAGGMSISTYSRLWTVHGLIAAGNGSPTIPGVGLVISGQEIDVHGGIFDGVNSDAWTATSDPSTFTKVQSVNITVASTAVNVRIFFPYETRNAGSSRGITVIPGATNVRIWQIPTTTGLIPTTTLLYGSPGSMMIKSDAANASDVGWFKVAGAVDAIGTWRRIGTRGVTSKSADYTALVSDDVITVNASTGARTITLPAATGNQGITLTVKKTDNSVNTVTVTRSGAETIDGATTYVLSSQNQYVTVISDNANWQIVAK